MKELKFRYTSPAPDNDTGWERQSLPLGNGHFGVSVFGLVESERLQVTENSVETAYNLTDAAELRLNFPHKFEEAANYERGLSLDNAIAWVKYDFGGVHYEREYFTSYPDYVLAVRLTADKADALEFETDLQMPFDSEFGKDRYGRESEVTSEGNAIFAKSHLEYYNIYLSAQIRALSDGKIEAAGGKLKISGASEAVLYFSCDTNYILRPECFTEPHETKLQVFDPAPIVSEHLEKAASKGLAGYDEIRKTHIADYRALFGRVSIDIGGEDEDNGDLTTDRLLYNYRYDFYSHYLEQLYYQYGRYMLICSSRLGELPPNLQGIWNCHKQSPWGSGYWHNINVQMNYWPVFSTNLAELFESYSDLNFAYRKSAEKAAVDYAKSLGFYDESISDYGWTVGTAVYPYEPGGMPGGHSGPGTGAMTSKLFWDWWDFTRDEKILKEKVYPTIHGMSKSLVRSVGNYNGEYLSKFSASPEQRVQTRPFEPGERDIWGSSAWQYYTTVGCAFDQQMIEENGSDDLKCAQLLGQSDEITEMIGQQLGHYHPVEIGLDGQIKEYREEKFYGEIGETNHRHISQLVGLMPGTIINRDTPAWLDSAKRTLNFRTDDSTGWALAHRLNAWARTGDGNRAYKLFRNLIGSRTFDNLWDAHPPFQIDGNFGGTSGVTEMLLQSHNGTIDILPSLPDDWAKGSFNGLVARGNFEVGAKWENGRAYEITVRSNLGGEMTVYYPRISGAKLLCDGKEVGYATVSPDRITVDTEKGKEYVFTSIPAVRKTSAPTNASVSGRIPHLTWKKSKDANVRYNIYKNTDSASGYEVVAKGITVNEFMDFSYKPTFGGYTMYRITAVSDNPSVIESDGVTCVMADCVPEQ